MFDFPQQFALNRIFWFILSVSVCGLLSVRNHRFNSSDFISSCTQSQQWTHQGNK